MIRLIVLGEQLRQHPHLAWAFFRGTAMVSAGSYSIRGWYKSRFRCLGKIPTYILNIFNITSSLLINNLKTVIHSLFEGILNIRPHIVVVDAVHIIGGRVLDLGKLELRQPVPQQSLSVLLHCPIEER